MRVEIEEDLRGGSLPEMSSVSAGKTGKED